MRSMSYLQYIDYGDSTWQMSIISLHGFPSIRSKQNRELAENISKILKKRVRVVLYPGLSCEGTFSFTKTLDSLVNEFPSLSEQKSVQILGHSWGGFCALVLASKFPEQIKKMVLLSPLLKFSTDLSQLTEWFSQTIDSNSMIHTLPAEQLAKEFIEIATKFPTEKVISQISPEIEISLLQARADHITPTAIAEEMKNNFKGKFSYQLVDQDHSFLIDRPKLSDNLAKYFN
jgi:poly(3-hydroxyalkanoate) synthetase